MLRNKKNQKKIKNFLKNTWSHKTMMLPIRVRIQTVHWSHAQNHLWKEWKTWNKKKTMKIKKTLKRRTKKCTVIKIKMRNKMIQIKCQRPVGWKPSLHKKSSLAAVIANLFWDHNAHSKNRQWLKLKLKINQLISMKF